jgi:hypothetical protein
MMRDEAELPAVLQLLAGDQDREGCHPAIGVEDVSDGDPDGNLGETDEEQVSELLRLWLVLEV